MLMPIHSQLKLADNVAACACSTVSACSATALASAALIHSLVAASAAVPAQQSLMSAQLPYTVHQRVTGKQIQAGH